VGLTVIPDHTTSILKCTLLSGGGRHRSGEILEDNTMLIDVYATLSVGDIWAPLIIRFNRTHPSNYAGDKKQWPGYMTIGTLSSMICQMPSMHSIVMVALLPIPIIKYNIPQTWLDEQR
jgi:hypothetical protein